MYANQIHPVFGHSLYLKSLLYICYSFSCTIFPLSQLIFLCFVLFNQLTENSFFLAFFYCLSLLRLSMCLIPDSYYDFLPSVMSFFFPYLFLSLFFFLSPFLPSTFPSFYLSSYLTLCSLSSVAIYVICGVIMH